MADDSLFRVGLKLKEKTPFWYVLLLALIAPSVAASSVAANDEVLRVGTIKHNPPYVFEEPSAGIDIDSIRASFNSVGVAVEFVHAPLVRLGVLLDLQKIDAMTAFIDDGNTCAKSRTYGHWHDGVAVRRDLAKSVNTMADLEGLHVGMFPAAKKVFAHKLDPHTDKFASETTIFNTPSVLRMLQYARIDAYIGDSWGLDYLVANNSARAVAPPYEVAIKFEPTKRQLCFADDAMRDLFDQGLEQVRSSGRLDRIVAQYRQSNLRASLKQSGAATASIRP